MTTERRDVLIRDMCSHLEIPDADAIIATGRLTVEGFEVIIDAVEEDTEAFYLNFDYGIVTGGRTLRVFRLMLEANLTIYAQDHAQLGLDGDTGGIILIVRVAYDPDLDGEQLAELLSHYAEHGRYWRNNILQTTDDMFESLANGTYVWIRA
ncbi:molecular chaperone Tir [Ralstonia sp. A12]|uniref:CesT family type III secretion system chaperone n=1 Tax=Ralstonia sp. A12 TaxID=1217052 RepID=UPI000574D4BB|nr:CesT family type III secretion system chaperone [Ralstonia sp. A12]KHK49838.1 molecular chaperone Tir [Ralstonia sp. A12]